MSSGSRESAGEGPRALGEDATAVSMAPLTGITGSDSGGDTR